MKGEPIRVMIANDSPVELELLVHILHADPRFRVVATAGDGLQAVEVACRERPDVIAMDVHMPRLDGLGATRQIMERCPRPIVIVTVSASYLKEGVKSFRALEMGALTIVRTPPGMGDRDYTSAAHELVENLKYMSEVKVVRRWAERIPAPATPPRRVPVPAAPIRVVAVGASAGGPLAIQYVLANLPKNFPVPVLIVQHMASGFVEGFALWLQETTGLPVHVAVHGQQPLSGHVYLAPSDLHMGISPDGRIALSDAPPEAGLRPAIAHLLRSISAVYGSRAIGVLLSGMGSDGAAELKSMRQRGAFTIAQDKGSALVYGMPGEAVRLGAVSHELPLEGIPGLLVSLVEAGKDRR